MKHTELKLFAGAYLLYNAGRWVTAALAAALAGYALGVRLIARPEAA